MTRERRWWVDLLVLNVTLLCAGCGESIMTQPLDAGSDDGIADACVPRELSLIFDEWDPCSPAPPEVTTRYRVTALRIPTLIEANNGDPVGHNIDGRAEVCGVPDYAAGVDNALIGFTDALQALDPAPFDLRAALDAALGCPSQSTTCTPLELVVVVTRRPTIAGVTIEDGEGATLLGPFPASVNGSGQLRGVANSLELVLPFPLSGGGTADLELSLFSMVLTATVTETGITDFVIGGALMSTALEGSLTQLFTALGRDDSLEALSTLGELYDVQVSGGACEALSVGFLVSAELLTP